MNVKGITLFHLKSHLQKYRLGKQPKRALRQTTNDVGSTLPGQIDKTLGNCSYVMAGQERISSFVIPYGVPCRRNETEELLKARMDMHMQPQLQLQLEMQRKEQLQAQVEKHFEMCKQSEERYMNNLVESAYKMLGEQSLANGIITEDPPELTTLLPVPTNTNTYPFGVCSPPLTTPSEVEVVGSIIPSQVECSTNSYFIPPPPEKFQTEWTNDGEFAAANSIFWIDPPTLDGDINMGNPNSGVTRIIE